MLLWSLSSEVCTGWAGWHSSRFLGDERDLRVIFALGFPNHDQKIISPLKFQTSGPNYSTQSWERWGRKWNEVKACSACRDPMIIMDPPDASFLRRTCAFCLRRRWGNGMGISGRSFSELATQHAAILSLKDVLIFLNFLLWIYVWCVRWTCGFYCRLGSATPGLGITPRDQAWLMLRMSAE